MVSNTDHAWSRTGLYQRSIRDKLDVHRGQHSSLSLRATRHLRQKLIYTVLALALILLSRTSLMVYKQPWNRTKAMSYIHIIVADAMTGVVFCIVAEFVLHSVYPLSLFMLIDIGTLFYRLLYRGISEEDGMTEQ